LSYLNSNWKIRIICLNRLNSCPLFEKLSVWIAILLKKVIMSLSTGIFRIFIIFIYIFTVWFDIVAVGLNFNRTLTPLSPFLNGRIFFITHWAVVTQIIYNFVALLNDIFGTNENFPKNIPMIRKIKDYIFSTFAFSIAYYVFIIFWSLYFYDKNTLMPLNSWSLIPRYFLKCRLNRVLFFSNSTLHIFRKF
jgi:hypothetical protein